MRFSTFVNRVNKQLVGEEILQSVVCHNTLVQVTESGVVLVDRMVTEYGSLDEAVQSIRAAVADSHIKTKIIEEQYSELPQAKIVEAVQQHHGDIKITDTLIESYLELASSKIFTVDPVVTSIRSHALSDHVLMGRSDFKLNDGTVVVVTEQTLTSINNIFGHHSDVIEYMRANKENFLTVVNQLEG